MAYASDQTLIPGTNHPTGLQTISPVVNSLRIVKKNLHTASLGKAATWPQQQLLDEVNRSLHSKLPIRVIVLKARQIGISTMVEAVTFAMSMLVPKLRSLVISNEIDGAQHLLQMTQHYWDTFRWRALWAQKNKSAQHLSWDPIGSSIRISTARNTAAGRGRTIHLLHASEVAFWINAETLMTGLMQSIPYSPLSGVFLESTANGVGNYFHSMWEASTMKDGGIDFTPLFFPFHAHPEYIARGVLATHRLTNMTEEERILATVLGKQMSKDEVRGRLLWRRWAIAMLCQNDIDKFHQEFPATPEEAFIVTGTNIFALPALNACYVPMTPRTGEIGKDGTAGYKFHPQSGGRLKVYRLPQRGHHYMVAVDPVMSGPVKSQDYACIQVIDRQTWEQVAVWRGTKIAPGHLGDIARHIGYYYNTAMIAPERQGGGGNVIQNLLQSHYPKVFMHQKAIKSPGMVDNDYGWDSNVQTKPQAVSNLNRAVIDRAMWKSRGSQMGLVIHDAQTYQEMKAFIRLPNGRFSNSNQELHDDTVDALAIAITATIYESINLPSTPQVQDRAGIPEHVLAKVRAIDPNVQGIEGVEKVPIEDAEGTAFVAQELDIPPAPPWMTWNSDPDMYTGG